jgi:Gas vesicle protein
MNANTKVILGILGAVAAGAIIGLLLAPEKGTETRKKISTKANDWTSQLSDLFNAGKTEMHNLKSKASKAAGKFQQETNNLKSKGESYT